MTLHQSQIFPGDNKFHIGNGADGKHYWLTPPELYGRLSAEFHFDFDPCPHPLPAGFDGLTCEWGASNYVNPPFGSIIHQGRKKGPTAWVRKAILEWQKGKRVVLLYPVDKWVMMLLKAVLGEHAQVRNLGDVRWLATEDGSAGKGTGRHIACFILEPLQCGAGGGRIDRATTRSAKVVPATRLRREPTNSAARIPRRPSPAQSWHTAKGRRSAKAGSEETAPERR